MHCLLHKSLLHDDYMPERAASRLRLTLELYGIHETFRMPFGACLTQDWLYLSDFLALRLWPLGLPFISQDRVYRICQ